MSNIVKKNKDLIPLSMQEVEDRIAVIRNQEVIADADVAYLYGIPCSLYVRVDSQ